jgi:ribosomal protein S18 acetylase RimI-like enzyme
MLELTISWMRNLCIPGIASNLEVENIINEGHFIYTLKSTNNKIVGYLLIGKGRVYISDFERNAVFAENVAFVMDTFIQEAYRGNKLFNLLISAVKTDLQRKGYKKLFCHIRVDNTTSMAAYEKNGFKKIGPVILRKVLGIGGVKLPEVLYNDIHLE